MTTPIVWPEKSFEALFRYFLSYAGPEPVTRTQSRSAAWRSSFDDYRAHCGSQQQSADLRDALTDWSKGSFAAGIVSRALSGTCSESDQDWHRVVQEGFDLPTARLQSELTVFRGFSMTEKDSALARLRPVVHATVDPFVAFGFAIGAANLGYYPWSWNQAKRSALLWIDLPAGTPAICVQGSFTEYEVLLPGGICWKPVATLKDGGREMHRFTICDNSPASAGAPIG